LSHSMCGGGGPPLCIPRSSIVMLITACSSLRNMAVLPVVYPTGVCVGGHQGLPLVPFLTVL
jgi:hypothetical protein